MSPQKGIERWAAALLLLTVVGVVTSIFTYAEPIDTSREQIVRTLEEIAGDSNLFVTSTAFFILTSLIMVPLAAVLYLAFRSHGQALALLGAFGFIAGGVLNAGLAMARFALPPLAEDFEVAVAGSTQAAIILGDVRVVGSMVEIMASMGGMGIALGVFAFGILIARTGALPRWIGSAGIVSGIVISVSWIEFAHDKIEGILLIGLLIGLVFATMASIAMLVQGLRPAPAQ